MMKRLLILMLVFGMASVANAINIGDIELSFNGVTDGYSSVTEYDVVPSDYFVIDIWGNLAATGYDVQLNIHDGTTGFVPSPCVTIGAGVIYAAAGTEASMGAWGPPAAAPAHAAVHALDTTPPPGDTILVGKHFSWELHCEGEGDVYIDLLSLDRQTVFDSMIVHQVPEPATMALLGLGGLFLRRRRK